MPTDEQQIPDSAVKIIRGWEALRIFATVIRDPITAIDNTRAIYGDFFVVRNVIPFFPLKRKFVTAIGPEYNQFVLNNLGQYRNASFTWRGPKHSAQRKIHYGLARINGPKHLEHRRLLKPTFTRLTMAAHYDSIVRRVETAIDNWSEEQTIDAWREVRRMSVRISTDLIFGPKYERQGEELDGLLMAWFDKPSERGNFILPLAVPGGTYINLLRVARKIKRVLSEVIDERRASGTSREDLLDILIREYDDEGKSMDETDVYSHLVTMFFGSFENTANAVGFALMLLAQHPQIATELHDELSREVSGDIPSFDQVQSLPILDAIIKETLRILPPAPLLLRAARFEEELGGVPLQEADHVLCSVYHTHRMPEIFSEPAKFNPDRWQSIRPGPYEYLPFGAGPRVCIGAAFATVQMKLMVAMIVKRWRLQMVPNARVDRHVRNMLRPTHGLPMTVHRQDGQYQAQPLRGQINEMIDFPGDSSSNRLRLFPGVDLPADASSRPSAGESQAGRAAA